MKKLLKLLLGVVIVLVIGIIGFHFYLAGGEDATELPQGKAAAQAEASFNADSIQNDLERHLVEKNGEMLTAQIIRTIEDANDSIKNGKKEAGVAYLTNAKSFISEHMDSIRVLKGVDMNIVNWFVNTPDEELLNF